MPTENDLRAMLRERTTEAPQRPERLAEVEHRVASIRRRRVTAAAVTAAAVVIAVAALTLSGLTGHSTQPAGPSPSSATSAWTLPQACDYWATAAGPTAKASNAMHEAHIQQLIDHATASAKGTPYQGAPWTAVRTAAGTYATAAQTFADKLRSPPHPWPAPLNQLAPPMAARFLADALWAQRASHATSESAFTELWNQAPTYTYQERLDEEQQRTEFNQACPHG